MNLYDYRNITKYYVCGDIHGDFKKFFHSIKVNINKKSYRKTVDDDSIFFNDSLIFVCGDCGFGFNKHQYYIDTLSKYNTFLSNNNIIVIFLRGNHDDPSYFKEDKLGLSNIKCVDDYSVIKMNNHNILCVGGGISIDRSWRKETEILINIKRDKNDAKKIYWDDENVVYDENKLDEITNKGIKIDIVMTHSSPDFVFPLTKNGIKTWAVVDKELENDLSVERGNLTKIHDYLISHGHDIKKWCYGHFHKYNYKKFKNIEFVALDCDYEILDIHDTVESLWGRILPLSEIVSDLDELDEFHIR